MLTKHYPNFTTAYLDVLRTLITEECTKGLVPSFQGVTNDQELIDIHELIGASFTIDDTTEDRLDPTIQEIRQVKYEFLESFRDMVLNGDSNYDNLREITPRASQFIHDKPEGLPDNFSIMYGERIQEQLLSFLQQLVEGGRRAIMQIWQKEDYDALKLGYKGEFACTSSVQGFIRNNRMLLHVNMRSSNAYRILPIDYFIFQGLQKRIANIKGIKCGPLSFSFGSIHLLESDIPMAKRLVLN